ncbi:MULTISPECIES: hypothetical protein [Caballeronia]|jgi:hypothetical protein|uniref:hypothetical protein n=1 Tax=Caballeronia TaxID=1827195 RepID=UPI000A9C7605|nr:MULTISPECIES: hypothetical protein [Caballeronia]MCG7402057.1 hypothetical protein [Caballeronia zhejiangensis]MCI1042538.1 hypothetical protein [Caballeronia zhejiangensis]MDR5768561.1 hypothetical protein [Caballeronia sp. LZ028]MDR5797279.1 hypothetical protein [Caballeronia sp. LZ008]
MEVAVLVAAFVICPLGVAALFGFALFADKHFKDSVAMPRGHVSGMERPERRQTH